MKDRGYIEELKNNCVRKNNYTAKDLRRKIHRLSEIIVKYGDEPVKNKDRKYFRGNV